MTCFLGLHPLQRLPAREVWQGTPVSPALGKQVQEALGYWPNFISAALTKSNIGKKRIYPSLQFQVTFYTVRESGSNFRRLVTHPQAIRSEKKEHSVLACLMGSHRTPCLVNGNTNRGLALPTSIKTIPHRHTHRPTQCRQPLTESLFLDLGYIKVPSG